MGKPNELNELEQILVRMTDDQYATYQWWWALTPVADYAERLEKASMIVARKAA